MVSSSLLATIFFAGAALANGPSDNLHLLHTRQQFGGNVSLHPHHPDIDPSRNPLTLPQCTSDDSCKKPCRTPVILAKGIVVSVSEKVQAEARRRFGDAHCVKRRCVCAVSFFPNFVMSVGGFGDEWVGADVVLCCRSPATTKRESFASTGLRRPRRSSRARGMSMVAWMRRRGIFSACLPHSGRGLAGADDTIGYPLF
ncbi:hypothetical protein EJ03DRAFT_327082 [Teratosphaeria nubilosa]|uniref:Uncharacterized protein n=1 Tax=Teratosphaeria nubilosa TaxID=161662 RepID=A0A6G1LA33_9PEZI|nr:hypothetical protein EJ03DRAFT_327082 [Teratosphaeria nubilosa]